jgi:hypothetical protein
VRRVAILTALLLAGCQGDDARDDVSAKAKARAVAPTVASYGRLVSVGMPRKRKECAEARPFVAGPCFDVLVTREVPVLDQAGETTRIRTHVFVWLEREKRKWVVRHTSSWSPDVEVTVERVGGTSSSEAAPLPPWGVGGYAPQEPPRGR